MCVHTESNIILQGLLNSPPANSHQLHLSLFSADNSAPVVSAIDDITRTIPAGLGATTVTWTEPTATDNSGSVSLQSRSHAPGSLFPVGTTTVTYTFVDSSGSTASTSFNVVVVECKL